MSNIYSTITGTEIPLDGLTDEEGIVLQRLYEQAKIDTLTGLPSEEIVKIRKSFRDYCRIALPDIIRRTLPHEKLHQLLKEGARVAKTLPLQNDTKGIENSEAPLWREILNSPLGQVAFDISERIDAVLSEREKQKSCFYIHVGQSPDTQFHFFIGRIRFGLATGKGFDQMIEEGHQARGLEYRGKYLFPPSKETELALELLQKYGTKAENVLTGIFERAFHSVGKQQTDIGIVAVSSEAIDQFLVPNDQVVLEKVCDEHGVETVDRLLMNIIGLGIRLGVLRRRSEK
ncbi:MAG: hypothetical protein Q7R81_07005 [Candidatus Peregrinibacteria bacterium]|nr:hypothetical protein [Candidatus Peregrinibacteria bacterium]